MKIENLVCTCEACPSQWEANTDDGRGVYIRYRWGYLSIYVSSKPGQHGLEGKEVFGAVLGDDLDGVIGWNEVSPIIENIEKTD